MLKDFFEAPEIAAIFTTKDRNNANIDKAEGVECERIRVGKQSRKRDHGTKRAARKSRGYLQQNTDMSSTRTRKIDDAKKIASFNEDNVYYDYDDETGTIITKKHSVVNVLDQKKNFRKDPENIKARPNIDTEANNQSQVEDFEDFADVKANESYCPSDSAYDTNNEEFTDSLERLTIKSGCGECIDTDVAGEDTREKVSEKRESPYRRCRSKAICGRNCELCRGRNNNIVPEKFDQQIDNDDNDTQYFQKKGVVNETGPTLEYEYKTSGHTVARARKYGLFSSRTRGEDSGFREIEQRESLDDVQKEGNEEVVKEDFRDMMRQKYKDIEKALREHEGTSPGSTSSSPRSLRSREGSISGEYYENGSVQYLTEASGASRNSLKTPGEFVDMYGDLEALDYYSYHPYDPYTNTEYLEQTNHFEAFSCGPHLLMLYDFKAEHDNDVSAYKGDIVLLLDNRDRDWVWIMTREYEEGYVPRSLTVPYNDCEECRQEEIRQRKLMIKMEKSQDQIRQKLTRTESRSSTKSSDLVQQSPRLGQTSSRMNLVSLRSDSIKSDNGSEIKLNFEESSHASPRLNQTDQTLRSTSSTPRSSISNQSNSQISQTYLVSSQTYPLTDEKSIDSRPLSPNSDKRSVEFDQTSPRSNQKYHVNRTASNDQVNPRQTYMNIGMDQHSPSLYQTTKLNGGLYPLSPREEQINLRPNQDSHSSNRTMKVSINTKPESCHKSKKFGESKEKSSPVEDEIKLGSVNSRFNGKYNHIGKTNADTISHANSLIDIEMQEQAIRNKSIRLIALSSFESTQKDTLFITAGDVVYVDITEQEVPDWLWAYSPRLKKFGFIPESIIDQLRSSSV